MDQKTMTRIEAAFWSGMRVSAYSSISYLAGTIGARAVAGGSGTPDLAELKGWGLGALFAGGTALIAFAKNMLAPRDQVISK